MPKVKSRWGVVAGIATWLILLYWSSGESACLKASSCAQDDLVLSSIISLGMLGPAYFLLYLFHLSLKSRKFTQIYMAVFLFWSFYLFSSGWRQFILKILLRLKDHLILDRLKDLMTVYSLDQTRWGTNRLRL